MDITRREFLGHTSKGIVGAALAAGLSGTATESAHAMREVSSKTMKFRVGAMDGTIGQGGPQALAVAREIGLEGVQVDAGREAREKLAVCGPEVREQYKEMVEKTGVVVSSICMGLFNSYPLISDDRAPGWISDTIEAAVDLKARVILLAFFGRGTLETQEQKDKAAEVLKPLAPKAEKAGVILGMENTLSAEDNMRIVEKIGSPAVQVYYDVANSTFNGYDVPKEIRWLGDRICEFHFKDRTLLGQGKVDYSAIRDAVRDIGYQGWIILEGANPLGGKISGAYNAGFVRGLLLD
jgi:sugar phosphate isomerase/epimerase